MVSESLGRKISKPLEIGWPKNHSKKTIWTGHKIKNPSIIIFPANSRRP